MIHISEGNMKLGSIPNISLTPGETCQANVPCSEKCYAKKLCKLRPNIRANYAENLAEYKASPTNYFNQIEMYLKRSGRIYFRWHVAGDIPDFTYLYGIRNVARNFPKINFLLYTRFPIEETLYIEHPGNLSVLKSYWNGFDRNYDSAYPGFMAIDKHHEKEILDVVRTKVHTLEHCPGSCSDCHLCWNVKPGAMIYTYIH